MARLEEDPGHAVPAPAPPAAVLASVLAAGVMLTVAGCSHITPLGPDPAAMPQPHHLRSPFILQDMRIQPPAPAGGCPAGWVTLSGAGQPRPVLPHDRHAGNDHLRSGFPGRPVPAAPAPGTEAAPVQYGFSITVPAADVPALTAVTTRDRAPAPPGPPTASATTSDPPSALPAAPGSSSASRHRPSAGSSKSLCPAGIKLSSFSAYWPRLAEGGGRHHGYLGGPIAAVTLVAPTPPGPNGHPAPAILSGHDGCPRRTQDMPCQSARHTCGPSWPARWRRRASCSPSPAAAT